MTRPTVIRFAGWLGAMIVVGGVVTVGFLAIGAPIDAATSMGGLAASGVFIVWMIAREFGLHRRVHRAIRRQRIVCIACGYPRPGHDGACPECGAPPTYLDESVAP